MTAEIAILNRNAIAFAADSAVTLGSGSNITKIYDTAEKIFELCRHQPLALMIYNNATFMEVPLEVLIGRFRETLRAGASAAPEFKKVTDVWPKLETFLVNFPREAADEHRHLQQLIATELGALQKRVQAMMLGFLTGNGSRRRKTPPSPTDLFIQAAKERRSRPAAQPLSGYLADKTIDDFIAEYGQAIEETLKLPVIVPRFAAPIEGDSLQALQELIFEIIKSSLPTSMSTGFVVGGFGADDIFPTLNAVEVDGLYFGRLRVINSDIRTIDTRESKGIIVPFAQKDMPQRFMSGVDKAFEDELERQVGQIVDDIIAKHPRVYAAGEGGRTKSAALKAFRDGVASLKRNAEIGLESVVNHMSKRELAEMAHSLVELTSHKRRFSNEAETVGGPIDVAILTRNEGFIWIRRKHYFDKQLNPGYFGRAYRA